MNENGLSFSDYLKQYSQLNGFGNTSQSNLGTTYNSPTTSYGDLSQFSSLSGSGGTATAPTNSGIGLNAGTFGAGIQGLGALANVYNAYQANKLAKKQFDFTKSSYETNLANSIKSYNTALADKASGRAGFEGWTPEQTAEYVRKNSM